MILRVLLGGFLALGLMAGCKTPPPYAKSDKKEALDAKDKSNDPAFQSFVGRLRAAVAKRDAGTLQSMMTADFGYRWDPPTEPESIFAFWDRNELWPELNAIVRERFVPLESAPTELYMVAPPQFAANPGYPGYRVGLRQERGSWKFAYFVPPQGLQ